MNSNTNTVLKKISRERYWNSLKKCWKAYKISKGKSDMKKQVEYATKILDLQAKLGLKLAVFPELSKKSEKSKDKLN